jgi:hypothetical protein
VAAEVFPEESVMLPRLLLLLAAAAAAVDPVAFPGAAEARDPTGRYAVTCVSAENSDGGGHHDLNLDVLKSSQSRRLLSFGRHATVFWAPDGNALAITDWGGSDFSTIQVFYPERPGATVDLGAELSRSFPSLPERERNHHVYLEAVRWLDAKTLRFRLRGYGDRDPGGFDLLFDYALGGDVRRARI